MQIRIHCRPTVNGATKMATTNHTLGTDNTSFRIDTTSISLETLCGLGCARAADGAPFRTLGPAFLLTDKGRFEGGVFKVAGTTQSASELSIDWTIDGSALTYRTQWSACPRTGVIRRLDSLHNAGTSPVTIYDCSARFGLAQSDYEAYCQSGRWVHENQGSWVALHAGTLELSCEGGRTTQGANPFVCVRERGASRGIAFHVLPRGNWAIRLTTRPTMTSRTAGLSIEIGQSARDLHVTLQPGQSWCVPEILLVALPDATPESGAPALHIYTNTNLFDSSVEPPPVVYNTWLDWFDDLQPERLRTQLRAAAELGCEVFTVDAGWFASGRGWYDIVGDWSECQTAAFHGKMNEFAAEVRKTGLKFGLWMEPERCGAAAPIRAQHPEFFTGGPGTPRWDIEQPQVYEYLRSQIRRLLDTYALDWMKIDYNGELGDDHRGTELRGYYDAWFRMLDSLRKEYPHTFFEGCSSGAMRLDLENLRHYHDHFLSDSCNSWDVIRIMQGAALRLPPGRIGAWIALQGRGVTTGHTSAFAEGDREQVFTSNPSGAQPCMDGAVVDPDFAGIVALLGTFGLSGDPASLPVHARQAITRHVAFYKKWRRTIQNGSFHLLTPVRPVTDHTGWAAVQMRSAHGDVSLVYVFRLDDSRGSIRVALQGLDAGTMYRVTASVSQSQVLASGSSLRSEGLECRLGRPNRAELFVVECA